MGEYEIYGLDINPPIVPVYKHYMQDVRVVDFSMPKFDCVIHLAALVNVNESEKKPIDYYMTNIMGTLNLLDSIQTDNFIFASTGAAESCKSAYGTSKRAAEDCVKEICSSNHTEYTIFRFYNVIGSDGINPTNPDGLMFNLLKAKDTGTFSIFGNDYIESWDGTCIRDYLHVNEVCDAIRTAIEKSSNKIECLGHGVGYTVTEMVNMFKFINNITFDVKYLPRREGDLASSVLENVSPYMKTMYKITDLLKL